MGSETQSDVELDWVAGAKQIDDCEYLFVDQIREIEELTLEVTITEAKLAGKPLRCLRVSAVRFVQHRVQDHVVPREYEAE